MAAKSCIVDDSHLVKVGGCPHAECVGDKSVLVITLDSDTMRHWMMRDYLQGRGCNGEF